MWTQVNSKPMPSDENVFDDGNIRCCPVWPPEITGEQGTVRDSKVGSLFF
jgi:hypothetical protein